VLSLFRFVMRLVGAFHQGIGILAQEIQRGGFLRRQLGCRHDWLRNRHRRNFGQQLDVAVPLESGSRRDQAAHDNVFLEAAQVIHFARDRGFGEDARGFLEARGGDE
jgi:hypothetical protein